ncbi:MAG: DUF5110 domain-containing protein [archaeon]|nr:DUF5110 domain-containing protein [archaeon]
MNESYIKEYFRFDCDPVSPKEAVVKGDKYRFTVLTSRLIRMEYEKNGKFEDRPTQTIWFRNLPVPSFSTDIVNNILKIETDDLLLQYNTTKKFSSSSLKVIIKNLNKTWKYGQKDRKNLKGTARTLDGAGIGIKFLRYFPKLGQGLLSKSGFTTLDDSDSLVFNENYWIQSRESDGIDIYFFGYGQNYIECLKAYYSISGKTPLIPRYILGNWWSRYWEYDEKELKELIETFQTHKIPLSVCIIDMDWHLVKIDPKYGRGWTGYTWNQELFPDPEGMLSWLHEKNLKVSLNLHPADGIKAHEDCYNEVADFLNIDKSAEEPINFNLTDPKFVSAYFDLVHHPHEELGVDFWWIDWQQGKKTKLTGLDPLWILNHLHFFDLGRNGKNRSFIFSRWGGKGNHRYPIGFSGDTDINWRTLAFEPYFTATASNVGFGWWSHDIGGHMFGKEKGELYTRWIQFGVFSPIMRLHSTKGKYYKREPWKYDLNTLHYAGEAMRLRHKLIPYIYSMAYQNFKHDIPLIRPLYYLEPNNEKMYKYKNQYWFGSEMMVVPITKPISRKTKRVFQKFILPKGEFFNFFTKEYFEGDREYRRLYQISDIPVFVRAGGIIPMAMDGSTNRNGIINPEHLKVEIFPGDSSEFIMYEDDGQTEDYRSGNNYKTVFTLNWNTISDGNADLTITLPTTEKEYIPKNRHFSVIFNSIQISGSLQFESDTNIDITSEIDSERGEIKVDIPNRNFSRVKIILPSPKVTKRNLIEEEISDLLLDADIITIKKNIIAKKVFKTEEWDENKLKKVVRKIYTI